ncbi:MAG: helix-turn-helix transcriptional regulator [Alphaproteobacteria bacterium]|nr:helix-turn-helix transcriptional regulator [Alphaproteobacteria bacterium]
MSVVLIDARAYGQQLRRARKSLHMNKATVAEILKISPRDLYLYEIGRLPIPPDLLCALLHRGLALTAVKTHK